MGRGKKKEVLALIQQQQALHERTYIRESVGPIMIRPFEARDIPAMVKVYNQYMSYYKEQKRMTEEQLQEFLAEPGEEIPEHTYVAISLSQDQQEMELLGYISLCLVKQDQRIDVFTYSAIRPWWIESVGLALFSYAEQALQNERTRRFSELDQVIWHWLFQATHLEEKELAQRLDFIASDEVYQLVKDIGDADMIKSTFLPYGYRFQAGESIEAIAWAGLVNQAFSWSPSSQTTAEAVSYERASNSFNPDYHIGLVNADNQLIGLIEGQEVVQENGEGYGFISTLAVTPSEQGKGLGKQLVLELLNRFGQFGLSKARLSVNAENPTSAAMLYRSLGFIDYAKVLRYKKEI